MSIDKNREEGAVSSFNLEPIAPTQADRYAPVSEMHTFREIEIDPEAFVDMVDDPPRDRQGGATRRRVVVDPVIYEIPEEILLEAEHEGSADQTSSTSGGDWLRISGALLLICAVVAMIVALVHAVTEEVIAEAALREKQAAMVNIFGEGMEAEQINPLAGTVAVYRISGGGYCVNLLADGFGGDIDLMVGVKADGTLCGVEIVSFSETPGLGAKVQEEDYLEQYTAQRGMLRLGEEIDAISGATISSRAVLDGVNAALAALKDSGLIGGEAK